MTHSPTPTELLALKTANAALMSPDSSYDFASTIVFALGSAQLLQSPETADELARLRARVAELEAGRATVLREAANAIVADNDRRLWASKPGTHWAADLLRRMAVEDQYVSPLHTGYRLGHDLPEAPSV